MATLGEIALSEQGGHAARMDAVYGPQRHIYDFTRKYYLLGRDRLIAELGVPVGGRVLEIGCGTGRNLAHIARSYPAASLHGLDISSEMLKSAQANILRAGCSQRTTLLCADASRLDPQMFGGAPFDRIVFSYTLSMIPDWKAALAAALSVLAPGGRIHIVDFGDCGGLPGWFSKALYLWLARFDVSPRAELMDHAEIAARSVGRFAVSRSMFRGYASSVVILG